MLTILNIIQICQKMYDLVGGPRKDSMSYRLILMAGDKEADSPILDVKHNKKNQIYCYLAIDMPEAGEDEDQPIWRFDITSEGVVLVQFIAYIGIDIGDVYKHEQEIARGSDALSILESVIRNCVIKNKATGEVAPVLKFFGFSDPPYQMKEKED